MSLFTGISFLASSLLLFRALTIWNRNYGPIGRFANGIMVNFLVPLIAAGFVTGTGICIVSVWSGTSLSDLGEAILTGMAFIVIWRGLGALPDRNSVVPFTPKPGATHSGPTLDVRNDKRAA